MTTKDSGSVSEELKPCPFCGSSKVGIASEHDSDTGGVFLSIKCSSCRASSGAGFSTDPCPQTYQEVRDEWNRRAAASAQATVGAVDPDLYVWFADPKPVYGSDGERFIRAWTSDADKVADLRDAIGKEPARYFAAPTAQGGAQDRDAVLEEAAQAAIKCQHGKTYEVDARIYWNNGIAEAVDAIRALSQNPTEA
ncbi:Lar family restriction alleviation protein [Paraburkholderia sp. BL9I2N2]|uniref:Lar family restriction alleviation protein n=1 Tax=Paraburkholderia sp. BL9I2N2 TaxID=1938809 RepID=UPI001046305D|nr:Lar family restriction alleviation protein [Paraburkholderia sp. BL9I2N2]TCK87315.1 Lar family restriction alleviation protein [Paraburkholderia sp. BL9I2N2]